MHMDMDMDMDMACEKKQNGCACTTTRVEAATKITLGTLAPVGNTHSEADST